MSAGRWHLSTSRPRSALGKLAHQQSVKEFSAAGYYFGVELQQELKRPHRINQFIVRPARRLRPGHRSNICWPSTDLSPTVERTKIWDAERVQVKAGLRSEVAGMARRCGQSKSRGRASAAFAGIPDACVSTGSRPHL